MHRPISLGTDGLPLEERGPARAAEPLAFRIIEGAGQVAGVFAICLLVAATAVICDMVVERWMLGRSTVWQSDFVVFATVASIFLGSPFVLQHKGHIGVDLLPTALKGRARILLDILASILSLLFCALIAWSAWHYFYEAAAGGWTTESVAAIPLWIPLLPMPIGFGLLSLQYLVDIVRAIKALTRRGARP